MVSARRAAASRMEILRLRCAAQTHKRTFYESLRSCESLRSSFPLGIHRRREQSTNNVQQVHAKGLDPASWLAVPHPLSSGVFRTHSQRAAFWRVESSQSRSRLLGFIRRCRRHFCDQWRPSLTHTWNSSWSRERAPPGELPRILFNRRQALRGSSPSASCSTSITSKRCAATTL